MLTPTGNRLVFDLPELPAGNNGSVWLIRRYQAGDFSDPILILPPIIKYQSQARSSVILVATQAIDLARAARDILQQRRDL
jgi:hypothetical protein